MTARRFGTRRLLRRLWMRWRWRVGDSWWLWQCSADPLESLACFDPRWYCERYGLELSDSDARLDYRSRVGRESLDPNPTFREAGYRRRYPDVAKAVDEGLFECGFQHYAELGWCEGREPGEWGVSESWYLRRYPEAAAAVGSRSPHGGLLTATEYYLVVGHRRGHDPNPTFDERWYLERYRDAAEAVGDGRALCGWAYHQKWGRARGHCGSATFDEWAYREANRDVDLGVRLGLWSAADHYSSIGWQEGRPLGPGKGAGGLAPDSELTTFDPGWYLEVHAEASQLDSEARLRAAMHYLERGRRDAADPNPLFWERWYLETYPDVAKAVAAGDFSSGFEHFLVAGYFEGKDANRLVVDESWYIANNVDVAESIKSGEFLSARDHYLAVGARQGRDPHAAFSERWYRREYPEVDAAVERGRWINAYHHLLTEGLRLGYRPDSRFSEELYLALNPDVHEAVRAGRWASGYEHLVEFGLAQGRRWRADDAAATTRKSALDLARLHFEAWLAAGEPLALPATSGGEPDVSVLLILHNAAALTLQCLESVAATAGTLRIEVVIVDNASTDRTREVLERAHGAKILRNSRNQGFVGAANQAAVAASGRYLLFLNNDAVLQPGAIEKALARLGSSPVIGAVGGRVVGCDGRLQEAGCVVWNDGVTEGIGAGDRFDAEPHLEARAVDYCSGVFLLTPRELFLELGGFDSRYAPAYYEEADYCLRLRELGRETWYEPQAVVYHLGQGSFERSWHSHELLRRNRPRFVERHRFAVSQAPRRGARRPGSREMPAQLAEQRRPAVVPSGPRTLSLPEAPKPAAARMVVLGMHRSGTSAVGRLLEAAGCWVGDQREMMPAKPDNPDGFWERADFVALNDRLLALVNRTWDTVDAAPLEAPTSEALEAERARLDAVLRLLDRRPAWALKDPRATVTLPWLCPWIGDYTPVVVFRHPIEVARSLQRREGFPLTLGLALWEAYARHLPSAVQGREVVLVRYESLLVDPEAAVARLLERLSQVAPEGPWGDAGPERLAAAVKADFRHQRASDAERSALSAQCRDLFDALVAGDIGALSGPLSPAARDVLGLHRQARSQASRLHRDLCRAGVEVEALAERGRWLEGRIEALLIENRRMRAERLQPRLRVEAVDGLEEGGPSDHTAARADVALDRGDRVGDPAPGALQDSGGGDGDDAADRGLGLVDRLSDQRRFR